MLVTSVLNTRPVDTAVIFYIRGTAREHGRHFRHPCLRAVYDGRSLASASRGPAVDMLTGGNKNMPRYSQQFDEGKVEREDSAHGDNKRRWYDLVHHYRPLRIITKNV